MRHARSLLVRLLRPRLALLSPLQNPAHNAMQGAEPSTMRMGLARSFIASHNIADPDGRSLVRGRMRASTKPHARPS
jgi:hypothetical protein